MLVELLDQSFRSVVEQVDGSIMERGKYPGPVLVEREALNSLGLRLEFLHHFFQGLLLQSIINDLCYILKWLENFLLGRSLPAMLSKNLVNQKIIYYERISNF